MLASTLIETGSRPSAVGPARVKSVVLDAALLAAALTVAATYFFQGGLEVLTCACVGALLGGSNAHWKNDRVPAALSGAFAGVFAGAILAAFFHSLVFAFF